MRREVVVAMVVEEEKAAVKYFEPRKASRGVFRAFLPHPLRHPARDPFPNFSILSSRRISRARRSRDQFDIISFFSSSCSKFEVKIHAFPLRE